MGGALIGRRGCYIGRMKNTPASSPSLELDSSDGLAFDASETNDMITTPIAPGTVRVLLSVDVPAAALASIEADWAMVAKIKDAAPEYVSSVVASALARLQEHAVQVGGVAVVEPVPDLVAFWRAA